MSDSEFIDVEKLYFDTSFRDYLDLLCARNLIILADDFQQNVFMKILENGKTTLKGCRRIAHRIAMQEYRTTVGRKPDYELREGIDGIRGKVIA